MNSFYLTLITLIILSVLVIVPAIFLIVDSYKRHKDSEEKLDELLELETLMLYKEIKQILDKNPR